MDGNTLVRTTLAGVRPLGVRGEPLHHAHAQIRTAIRRRLSDRHAALLAEPEPHDLGRAIDWYSEVPGPVVAVADLDPARRAVVLEEVAHLSSAIEVLGARLEAGDSGEARLLGAAITLATRRPSDDYVFLVGDQPVIVCWGYEPEAAGAMLPPPFLPAVPAGGTALPATAAMAPLPVGGGVAVMSAATAFPWIRALLTGLLVLLAVLVASWLLRGCVPDTPTVSIFREPERPALAIAPGPDPLAPATAGLRGEQDRERELRVELASLGERFRRELELCPPPPEPPRVADAPKPAETPKPPPVKVATAPAPKPADCPPPPPAGRPRAQVMVVLDGSDSMNLPSGFTGRQEQALIDRGRAGDRTALPEYRAMTRGGGQKRIDDAKQAASRVIPRLPADVDVGYMVFDDCRSIQDHGFFGTGQRGQLLGLIQGTVARGGTPLARAVQRAGEKLSSDEGVIVVLSDGKDSCGGNVCAVAQALHASRPKVKIHVIDLAGGNSEATCLATITGGRVYTATNAPAVAAAMQQATASVDVPANCRAAR